MTECNFINVLVAEDSPMIRAGLRSILLKFPDLKLVGEAGDGEEAITKSLELKPDLVLMDIRMPVMNGIAATRAIKSNNNKVKVIILSGSSDDEEVFGAFKNKADGYCLKTISSDQLHRAILAVSHGAVWLDPQIAHRVLKTETPKRDPEQTPQWIQNTYGFTAREYDVLDWLVSGLSNAEIGAKLFLSGETVKTHIRHIMQKLNVESRTQVVSKTLQEHLLVANELRTESTITKAKSASPKLAIGMNSASL